jgi:hypothetical protein
MRVKSMAKAPAAITLATGTSGTCFPRSRKPSGRPAVQSRISGRMTVSQSRAKRPPPRFLIIPRQPSLSS